MLRITLLPYFDNNSYPELRLILFFILFVGCVKKTFEITAVCFYTSIHATNIQNVVLLYNKKFKKISKHLSFSIVVISVPLSAFENLT